MTIDASPQKKHRIVLNGHAIFNAGFEWLLTSAVDLVTAAAGHTVDDVLRQIDEHRPDVVVVEVGSGADDVVMAIIERAPDARLLLMVDKGTVPTVLPDVSVPFGCLTKTSAPSEILAAIRSLACGSTVFGDGVFTAVRAGIAAHRRSVFPALTEREHEVLALAAAGFGNADVARRLKVVTKTVRNHMSNILMKLRVSRRSEAVDLARLSGLTADVTQVSRSTGGSAPEGPARIAPQTRTPRSMSTAQEPVTIRSTGHPPTAVPPAAGRY